ncbi:hypothetical protein Ancab_014965 [Ancistrocladus abbreviatus]
MASERPPPPPPSPPSFLDHLIDLDTSWSLHLHSIVAPIVPPRHPPPPRTLGRRPLLVPNFHLLLPLSHLPPLSPPLQHLPQPPSRFSPRPPPHRPHQTPRPPPSAHLQQGHAPNRVRRSLVFP